MRTKADTLIDLLRLATLAALVVATVGGVK